MSKLFHFYVLLSCAVQYERTVATGTGTVNPVNNVGCAVEQLQFKNIVATCTGTGTVNPV